MTKARKTLTEQQSPARQRLQQALGRLAAGTALAQAVKSGKDAHQAGSLNRRDEPAPRPERQGQEDHK